MQRLLKRKMQNNLTIFLIKYLSLAISIVFLINFCPASHAQTLQTINLNNEQNRDKSSIRFQTANLFPQCDDKSCFRRPSDLAISSDDSFALIVDSSKEGEQGIFLRKFNFLFPDINSISSSAPSKPEIKSESIQLIQSGTEAPLLNITLSKNNNKVAVYREPTETENNLVQIIDLKTNTIKELNSVTTSGIQIGIPDFIDSEGKKLIAGTIDPFSPELVVIDTESDQITNSFALEDEVQSVRVSPNLKQTVITFKGTLAQSVAIFNNDKNELSQLDIDSEFAFSVDDILSRIDFNSLGNKAALSSLGGNHVFHLLDLESSKLITKILDKLVGPSFSTITTDGMAGITVGSLLDSPSGFKVYKVNISNDGSISPVSSSTFTDGSIVLDLKITPDQTKIYIIILKDGAKQLLILNMKDLSRDKLINLSPDNTLSSLEIAPNGSYAITTNINESSVSLIQDLFLGPILRKIIPDIGSVGGSESFIIDGFINPQEILFKSIQVCFRNNETCAPIVSVSRDGKRIQGITPKVQQAGFADVFLSGKDFSGNVRSSVYSNIYQFVKGSVAINDTFPPEITIAAPKDLSNINSKRVLVIGKIDGTGTEVSSVTVNGKKANLSSEGQASVNVVNFISDLEFTSDGTFEIKVAASDLANNSAEKTINVTIDTALPLINAGVEATSQNQFNVTGTIDGTGTDISSITVNSIPVEIKKDKIISFTATTNTTPITIVAVDGAGNKNKLEISSAQANDKTPPTITINSPENAQIFKDNPQISVTFTVQDDTNISEVLFNGTLVTSQSANQFSQSITLNTGENPINITAKDTSGNTSSKSIKVIFVPSELQESSIKKPSNIKDLSQEKEVVTLPPEFDDLNEAVINSFTGLSVQGQELFDIASTVSIEIFNPPPIPEGEQAQINIPRVEGLDIIEPTEPDEPQSVSKGFSFATSVDFTEGAQPSPEPTASTQPTSSPEQTSQENNAAVLIDSTGRAFIVGFAYRETNEETGESNLVTTFSVPQDATEGDAKVSVLSGNMSIATIPIDIASENDVQVGKKKKDIAKPQVIDPIKAIVKQSGRILKLRIKGRNFIGRKAIIDGQLEKLASKAQFFTNVTFVPSKGITIKDINVRKKLLFVTVEIDETIEPGIKLFNVVTPKGSDIGAIVFPEILSDGKLQTTANPAELILGDED